MKFTDQEIDSIALAIYNAAREAAAQPKVESLGAVHQPLPWRMAARAALAARDALFEVVGERWEVRWPVRRDKPDGAHAVSFCTTSEHAHAEADEMRRGALVGVRVIHVTTKRRKRA